MIKSNTFKTPPSTDQIKERNNNRLGVAYTKTKKPSKKLCEACESKAKADIKFTCQNEDFPVLSLCGVCFSFANCRLKSMIVKTHHGIENLDETQKRQAVIDSAAAVKLK
jgi:hypothetical protein